MTKEIRAENRPAGNRLFKMLNNEVIFGKVELTDTGNGEEILVKKPFTIVQQKGIPYMGNVLGSSPAAIQIHPMNVLWSVALDEFKEINDAYNRETSSLILP